MRAARTTAGATLVAAVLSAVTVVGVTTFQSRPSPAAPSSPPASAPNTTEPPGTTEPPQAAPASRPAIVELSSKKECPEKYLCLYPSGDHSGALLAIRADTMATALTDIPCDSCGTGTWNDRMQSWTNNSDITYCWFSDSKLDGEGHVMTPRTEVSLLELEKDIASSISFGSDCDGL